MEPSPVQRRHAELRRDKVHICSAFQKNFDTLTPFLHDLGRFAIDALSAQEALLAGKVQGGVHMLVWHIYIKWLPMVFPFVEYPLCTCRIAKVACFVNWQVPIFVFRLEYLIYAPSCNGFLKN